MDVMTTAGSSQTRRDVALTALKAHMNDWRADRAKALELKDHASGFGRDTCYECDDKCGSHWLMMPVAPEGRDTKDLAKHKFDFAIQSNTVDIEWPPGSGRWSTWPEIDRAAFFTVPAARERMKFTQQPLIDRLSELLARLPVAA